MSTDFRLDGNPWRCWERTTLAGVLNGPADLLVRVALLDRRTRVYQSEFRWPAMVRLGANDFGGQYANVILRFGEVRWSLEVANVGKRTCIIVRALNPDTAGDVQIRLETQFVYGRAGQVVAREEEVVARVDGEAWSVSSPSPSAHRDGATITAPLSRAFVAVIEPAADAGRRLEERTVGERIAAGATAPLNEEEREVAGAVAAARRAFRERFSYVPDELWWAYAGVVYGIGWNQVWARDRGEPVAVCSRDWCVLGNYGDWVLFNWDTFMLVPMAADYDRALAHQIVAPQLAVQAEDGLVPGIVCPLGMAGDRGMPPTSALGLWKAYLRTQDRSFVERYYPALKRYHEWWRRNRDGNGDGLLEWGSNPYEAAHPQWQAHTYWASRYETGMDNHPMWDGVKFNPDTNTQEQSDIGLNALHALDALCLGRMAALLGHDDEASAFAKHAQALTRRIEAELWNDDVGLWLSRGWDGRWNHRAAPTCFYTLGLPGLADAHVQRAIEEHLDNEKRFGGRYRLPVSPRDDAAYPEQYYVRGRVWPEQTLLVHMALRETGREEVAARLARSCLDTMRAEWLEEGHLHECYNAETADGEDTAESDPLYSFGTMMPAVAWFQLRDWKLDGTPLESAPDALEGFLDRDGALRRQVDPLDELPELA